MGVTKKPAVIAKTARTVKLTRSDIEMAKHFDVPLETVAKAKLKVRGRPVGSKNKPKEKPVDWEKLAKQLQEALAHEMKLTEKYENASLFQRIKFLFTGRV